MGFFNWLFGDNKKENMGPTQYTDPTKPGYLNPRDNGTRFPTCPLCLANRQTLTQGNTEEYSQAYYTRQAQQAYENTEGLEKHRETRQPAQQPARRHERQPDSVPMPYLSREAREYMARTTPEQRRENVQRVLRENEIELSAMRTVDQKFEQERQRELEEMREQRSRSFWKI